MKSIEPTMIRFSIKYFPVFIVISVLAIILASVSKIPVNNFELIVLFGAIITALVTCYFNSRDDMSYNKAMNRTLDQNELMAYRGKSMYLAISLGSVFILFFSSISVNHFMTHLRTEVIMNGKKVEGFKMVNIFQDNTFKCCRKR